jgi:hypothetical protein
VRLGDNQLFDENTVAEKCIMKHKMMNRRPGKLLGGLLAAILVMVTPAQAETVLCGESLETSSPCVSGDTNATGILELDVDGVLYNVEFKFDFAADLFTLPFIFNVEPEALNAAIAASDALNALPDITTVNQQSFFGIPFELEPGLGYTVRSAEFFPVAGGWQPTTGVDLITIGTPSSWAVFTVTEETVDLTGTVQDPASTGVCALVLASGQFMFSCNPNGPFSLLDLPRESDGTVKRQIYADGFFPNVEILQSSVDETVTLTRVSSVTGSCPDYNTPYEPGVFPDSAGKRIDISGTVLLRDTQIPLCAMALANGQFGFTCDGTGSYAANIPLDENGQYKLQVYADGFVPSIQVFDEFQTVNDVRMTRAAECQ